MFTTKNIVISGTNFWNPGDDFVRDGVIKILHYIFPNDNLSFQFYNFNQDYFPVDKFTGIHNMLSKGDLDKSAKYIDAVVIAGLSAGLEIKDLYNWIIKNHLENRVYLIGAGYENDYVAQYILQEPEKTIFINAKVIIGRTQKVPSLIHELKLPYHYINCPALLSVEKVKDVPADKKIERIGFSIQIPHEIGVANQATSRAMSDLTFELLKELSSEYEVHIIAHHKEEYFYFLELVDEQNVNAKVYFSSFYQDLHQIYPQFDLFVTTRLHSGLFANGFGIPSIIINDTDRHTHCLQGFQHSVWVNSKENFYEQFEIVKQKSLKTISEEMHLFKQRLIGKYLEVLAKPFGINVNKKGDPEKIAELIKEGASSIVVKKRVLEVFEKLDADYWLKNDIDNYRKAVNEYNNKKFDTVSFLNWFADKFQPQTYLEIGVCRGRSIAQVLSRSKDTQAVGIDLWIENYSSIPEKNIVTTNPGPDFVISELRKFGITNMPQFFKGDSQKLLPEYFASENHIQYFDLILVDGDHSYQGARFDLEMCIPHLKEGGALIFNDINHVSHPELKILWNELKTEYPKFLFLQDESGTGTGIMIKPSFNTLLKDQKSETKASNDELPIHFFTIVLNGKPFIDYHIEVLKNLPFKWHWHIIEGVADLKHDTSWSLENGGRISDQLHLNGLSKDGTTEYIDKLVAEFPEDITVYRKGNNSFWEGKIEMVNAPLPYINEECLLWEIDADELWTAEQIIETRKMFIEEPTRTAAYFYCNYFVGENKVIVTKNTYGNHTAYEWLRVWKYQPGDKWLTHEPPQLSRQLYPGIWADLGKVNVFTHNDTRERNVVFQHYAYTTEEQLLFKEIYYGYEKPVEKWKELNKSKDFPVLLSDYFDWVKNPAVVEEAQKINIKPLAVQQQGKWVYDYQAVNDFKRREIFLTSDYYSAEAETKISEEKFEEAKKLLNIVLSLDGNNLDAKNNLAVINIMQGEHKNALRTLKYILSVDPANEIALNNIKILMGMTDFVDEHIGVQISNEKPLYLKALGNVFHNIVWLRTDSIGDNILAASTLKHISHCFNLAKITVVCQNHIKEIYERCPYVSQIIGFDKAKMLSDQDYKNKLFDEINKLKPDLFLNSVYSSEKLTHEFAGAISAEIKIGFDGDIGNISEEDKKWGKESYTHLIQPASAYLSEVKRNEEFLDAINISHNELNPVIWLSEGDEKWAEEFFIKNKLNKSKTLAFFAGTQQWQKFYKSFGRAIKNIVERNDYSIVVLGNSDNQDINLLNVSDIKAEVFDLSGGTTIRQAAAIIKRCIIAVGSDTGLAHIACVFNIPNVILLGGGHFGRFLPYSNQTSVVCLPMECYGCDWRCNYETAHCVKDIDTTVFEEAVTQTLKMQSNKPRIFVQKNSIPENEFLSWISNFVDTTKVEIIPTGNSSLHTFSDFTIEYLIRTLSHEELLKVAESEIEKNQLNNAKEILNSLLDYDPNNIFALNDLAVVDILDRNYSHAAIILKQVLALEKNNEVAIENMAYLINNKFTFDFIEYKGFYNDEGSFRWADKEAELIIPEYLLTQPIFAKFNLTCVKNNAYSKFPFGVSIFLNNKLINQLIFDKDDKIINTTILIPASNSKAIIKIVSEQFFIPAVGGLEDARRLSVMFSGFIMSYSDNLLNEDNSSKEFHESSNPNNDILNNSNIVAIIDEMMNEGDSSESTTSSDGIYIISDMAYQFNEEEYDKQYGYGDINQNIRKGFAKLISENKVDISHPLIEIGAGTGVLSLPVLTENKFPLHIITDSSAAFLKLLKRKMDRVDINAKTKLCSMKAEEIELFPDKSFSVIALRYVLHHLVDWKRFIAICKEKLVNGGALIFEEPLSSGFVLEAFTVQFLPVLASMDNNGLTEKEQWSVDHLKNITDYYLKKSVDKSWSEDKHVFQLEEIWDAAQEIGLYCKTYPGAGIDTLDPYKKDNFMEMFLYNCKNNLSFPQSFVDKLKKYLSPYADFINKLDEENMVSYNRGVILLKA